MWTVLVGVFLIVCGLLLMVREALGRRRLSGPSRATESGTGPTLEPARQGLGFLGLVRNWPGMALMAIGAVLLLFG
ncbi:hypothetical protein QN219_00120 [Sinorhizobium sp. 7-81]|uniref:hypothetical protein n=1 Tax=Sinorhizobium sp. 8-89 TaxID=3049089 RepID=UPI0024C41102|nr:hypothetical protein [Sinorhizobium sp. 8-89]MDK1488470.1 hypothetical protein [Sinorhizobium sp. 8-89]